MQKAVQVVLFIAGLLIIASIIYTTMRINSGRIFPPGVINSKDTTISGMEYTIFVSGTGQLQVINKTRDSFEVVIDRASTWDEK